jgi:hypothetical protein
MKKIVRCPLTAAEANQEVGEFPHEGIKFFLADEPSGAGRDVTDANARLPLDGFRKILAVSSGKDIHLIAQPAERVGHLGDIEVLAPTVDAAE